MNYIRIQDMTIRYDPKYRIDTTHINLKKSEVKLDGVYQEVPDSMLEKKLIIFQWNDL